MKTVEIRRHSVRDKPDPHLSPTGREIARQVGRTEGWFQRAISSPSPRSLETARAMGVPDPELGSTWEAFTPEVDREIGGPAPFSRYASILALNGAAAAKAAALRTEITRILESLLDQGAALIIAHGGLPELVAVAFQPTADHSAWGGPIRCMEGVRLSFDGRRARGCEILRLPPSVGPL